MHLPLSSSTLPLLWEAQARYCCCHFHKNNSLFSWFIQCIKCVFSWLIFFIWQKTTIVAAMQLWYFTNVAFIIDVIALSLSRRRLKGDLAIDACYVKIKLDATLQHTRSNIGSTRMILWNRKWHFMAIAATWW